MGCDSTATIATDPETYANQRLRCDSALPPDYHAECHGPFCHAALTSTYVDTPKSVASVAVPRDDCHHCHGPRDQSCASPCRPVAALHHGQRPERQSADRQCADDQAGGGVGRGGGEARLRPPG
jgi:hypothetical protein